MTEYIILKKDPGANPGQWEQYGGASYDASSARRALAVAKVPAGEYVAIPARSFIPLTVKTEQVTKVTIG